MENTTQPNNAPTTEDQLNVTYQGAESLKGAAKWAKLLAILGLSMMALLIILMSIMAFAMPGGLGFLALVIYLVVFGIAAIPLYFLYKFATATQEALGMSNSETLADGLNNLKSYFLIQGVFAIIALVFYAIVILIMLATGGAMMKSLYGM